MVRKWHRLIVLLLACLTWLAGTLPPMPKPGAKPERPQLFLRSPKDAAFRGRDLPMLRVIIAPPMLTNYGYADFPPAVCTFTNLTPEGKPISFTFTNLLAWVDVQTNNGPWHRLRSAPYPREGGRMYVTNVAPAGTLIYFRPGYTFMPSN